MNLIARTVLLSLMAISGIADVLPGWYALENGVSVCDFDHEASAGDACDEPCRKSGCTPSQHACQCCHVHAPTLAPKIMNTKADPVTALFRVADATGFTPSTPASIFHPPRS